MRFYNPGKFNHVIGRDKDSGEMKVEVKDLAPADHPVGTCIVNFPGSNFKKTVKAGDWIDVPDDLSVDAVKSACPALLTEAEYNKNQPAAKPAKG